MARARYRLSAGGVKAAGAGSHGDGGGLTLVKADKAAGKWIWRYQRDGRRRDMGLGSWPDVGLAQARQQRAEWAEVLATGRDPIGERDRRREADRAAAERDDPTLADAVARTLAQLASTLREGGDRGRWRSPLDQHVLPTLGSRRVSTLTDRDVEDVLKPIWRKMPPTAFKVRLRLRNVLKRGRLSGWPCDPEIVDRAVIRLGEVRHVATPIVATPWEKVPALYARLSGDLRSHHALRLVILTALRLDAVLGIRGGEIEGDVWTVPADRMKGREGMVADFRVPLSAPALAIVDRLREVHEDGLLLAGAQGGALTSRAAESALDDLEEPGRPHGFRSSFKDWTRGTGQVTWEVAETCLSHAVGNKVERSYQRNDLLDQRRVAMALWADFVTGIAHTENVAPIAT